MSNFGRYLTEGCPQDLSPPQLLPLDHLKYTHACAHTHTHTHAHMHACTCTHTHTYTSFFPTPLQHLLLTVKNSYISYHKQQMVQRTGSEGHSFSSIMWRKGERGGGSCSLVLKFVVYSFYLFAGSSGVTPLPPSSR